MGEPFGPAPAGVPITVVSGNQYQGDGNAGNQLQDGSQVWYRAGADWTPVGLSFLAADQNNKYFAADLPGPAQVGDAVDYYLQIAYDDHDTTFVFSDPAGVVSIAGEDEGVARAQPFRVVAHDPAVLGRWTASSGCPTWPPKTPCSPTGAS